MCNEIKVGSFTATQDEKGNWIYKADENKVLKKGGTLKKEYKELPRFDVINDMEREVTSLYENTLKIATKQITNKIKQTKIY